MNDGIVEHIPVLANTLAEQIHLPQDGVMVDATIGHGGHSELFGQFLGAEGAIIGLDVDEKALEVARLRLGELACKVILLNCNFSETAEEVRGQGIEKVDFILADLGVCSAQLDDVEMGLSFQKNMPLDMRLDKRLTRSAADIIKEADEKALADLIYKYGQDRGSRRIARFIVQYRRQRPVKTTGELAAIVCKALGQPEKGRKSRIHPATRCFQALRIAVNNELENLEKLLCSAGELLKKDGYVAVISYHSLEDKVVKDDFKRNDKDGIYRIITKKPLVPSREEVAKNRRARSAKLRIAQKQ